MRSLYLLLLRILPRRMREAYGQEMEQVFQDRLRDRPGSHTLYLREMGGLLAAAIRAPRESPFTGLASDIRAALRSFVRRPKFSAIAVVLLAVGIGGATAMYSMLDAWVLSPLPFSEPERLLHVIGYNTVRGWDSTLSPADYEDLRKDPSLETAAAWYNWNFNLTGVGEPERVRGVRVSASFFSVLGVHPALGRDFLAEEDQPGAARSVILSYEFWETHFLADRGMIGKTILIDDEPATVAGVLPPHFQFTLVGRAQIYQPLALSGRARNSRDQNMLSVTARRKPSVTLEQTGQSLSLLAKALEARYPDTNANAGIHARTLAEEIGRHQGNQVVWAVFGLTLFVLLIVCSNVGNLVLARAVERQKEIAVRFAMGASRGRVIRQMLVENVMLFLAGAAGSVPVAIYITHWVSVSVPYDVRPYLRDYAQISVHFSALLFSLALAFLTGILFGMAPAIEGSRAQVHDSLKEASRGSAGRRGRWIHNTLVAGEIALALALLVAGGLLSASLKRLWSAEPAFQPTGLMSVELALSLKEYPDLAKAGRTVEDIATRTRALPGVTAVSASEHIPFGESSNVEAFWIEGRPDPPRGVPPGAYYSGMMPGFFATMGIPLLAGRDLSERDDATSPRVIVINDVFARQQWPGESPLGKRVRFGSKTGELVEIVGVVRGTKVGALDDRPVRQAFVPMRQHPARTVHLMVRAADPPALVSAIREQVRAVDRNIPVPAGKPMDAAVAETYTPHLLTTQMVSAFSLLALAIAATGLYAVMAWSVTQRTREMGIRMALGASAANVQRMILLRAARLIGAGLAVGLILAAAGSQALTIVLFQVNPRDPLIFGGVTAVLAAVALVASYIPARRAARLDPVTALRHE